MQATRSFRFANTFAFLAAIFTVTLLIAAPRETKAQASVAAPSEPQVRLGGHMAPEVMGGTATLLRHYEPTQKLRLAVVLALPDPAGEQQFLADVYDKSSPLFHQFLSPEEWRERFGPTAESEQAVVDWAQSQGFTVTHRYNNRLVVDLEAPSGTIEQALNLTMNSYQLPAAHGDQARTVFSNDREPSIPARLSGVIDAVLGLNSIVVMRPSGGSGHLVPQPDYSPGPVVQAADSLQKGAHTASETLPAESAAVTNGTSTPKGYTPQTFWNSDAYDYQALMNQGHCCNPTNDASGHSPRESSIAIASFGDVSFNDVNQFQAYFSNLALYVDKIRIDGTYACSNNDDNCSEVTMDTEWSVATANSQGASASSTARVVVYEGANYVNSTIMDLYNQMEDDAHARTMTTSWGYEENQQFSSNPEGDTYNSTMYSIHKIFSTMAGEGWTLVAASGDQGATAGCTQAIAVQFPSSDWYVVGAGGTELTEGNPYEVAWTGANYLANPNANPPTADACDNNSGGSTGGFSEYFPAPSFQSGMGFSKRAVPDLALDTTLGHDVYFQGSWIHPGGTSVAAPMLAGFFAQENAYLLSIGSVCGSAGKSACAPIGNANNPIYDEGNHPNAAHYPFYDITVGCNSNDITTHDPALKPYCAGPGYDEVTGWGSANMLQLAWAINWEVIPASGSPYITWSGPVTNRWYNTNQTVSWKVSDYVPAGDTPSSGIAGETQGWDSLPSDPYREPHGGSGNSFYDGPQFPNTSTGCLAFEPNGCSGGVSQGCHTAYARGWNNQGWNTSGNSSYPETYGPICYDTVAPTLNVVLNPAAPTSTGWYRSPVTIKMSASDPGGSGASGVANIYYGIGVPGCATNTTSGCSKYGSQITLGTSQAVGVTAFSEDKAGNFSPVFGKTVLIDTVPPVTTLGFNGVLADDQWDNSISIVLKATDDLSQIETTYYKIDNGPQTAYTGPFPFATIGSHTIYYWSVDKAGNVEKQNGDTFQLVSTTAIQLTATPNPSAYQQLQRLTATVSATDGGTLTGTVTFYNGGTKLASVNPTNGVAVMTTSALPIGNDSLYATFTPSGYYLSSTSSVFTETVLQPTATTLTVSPTTAIFGSTVSVTAKVTASVSGTPAGTVNFYNGSNLVGSAALNASGIAVYSTDNFPAGLYSFHALYAGNSSYNNSTSATKSATITQANSKTALITSAKTSTFDELVTLAATVTSTNGTPTPTPTGTVTFKSNGTTLGTGTLANGVASLITKSLPVGSDSITAIYDGSTDFTGSTSPAVSVVESAAPTSSKLASSEDPSPFGTSIKLTATVTSAVGAPPGTVTFKDGTMVLGTETLVGGTAILPISSLSVGTHSITATYVATTDYASSTSAALSQSVLRAATTTTLKSSVATTSYDANVTLTATVTTSGGMAVGTPAGTVTFLANGKSIGTVAVSGGVAVLSTKALPVGTDTVTASYGGSADFNGTSSTPVSIVVDRAPTSTKLVSSLTPSTVGEAVTFTATVTSAAGTVAGTVTFKNGTASLGSATLTSGSVTLRTTALTAGTHSMTAVYAGTTDYAGSTSVALAQTVKAAPAIR